MLGHQAIKGVRNRVARIFHLDSLDLWSNNGWWRNGVLDHELKIPLSNLTIATTSVLAASPWVLCLLSFSGLRLTLFFLGTCIVLAFSGFALLRVFLPALRLESWILLSLPFGLVVASFVCASAARFDVGLVIPAVFLVLLFLMGVWSGLGIRSEVVDFSRLVLPAGGLAVVLSGAICIVYFLPSLFFDATVSADGSIGWLYTDGQWYMAMTTSIVRGGSPPDMPGLAGAPLWYHYGQFAVAAMLHNVFHCGVGDSLYRIVGGIGRISLALSVFAFGGALGFPKGRPWNSGLLAVFGLFFVGELAWPLRILKEVGRFREIPNLPQENWEPFAHIVHGASLLWGLVGLFVLLSVLLERGSVENGISDSPVLPFFAALIVPLHGLVALGAAGASWLELSVRNYRRFSYLAAVALGIVVTSLVFWSLLNPLGLAGKTFFFDPDLRPALFEMFMYFFLGLGVLLLGLDWLRSFPKTATSRVLMILLIGFVPLTVILENRDFNDYYGVRFATAILAVFAMARLGTWIGESKLLIARRVLCRLGIAIMVMAGIFLALGLAIIVFSGPGSRRFAMLPEVAVAAALCGSVLVWLGRKGRAAVIGGTVIIGLVFAIQATAWVPVFFRQAIRKVEAHGLSAGEVDGLLRLRELSTLDSLCVTNRHKIPGMTFEPARSYMYTALSERAFVLEGWQYREMDVPEFQDARAFSEQVFSTSDPDFLCKNLGERGVNFIVARPGTDLHVNEGECDCLQKIPDCGSLGIYRVRPVLTAGAQRKLGLGSDENYD